MGANQNQSLSAMRVKIINYIRKNVCIVNDEYVLNCNMLIMKKYKQTIDVT